MTVRPAAVADLVAMTDLAEARRRRYADDQPVFWRPSADAREQHRRYLAALISDASTLALVAVRRGAVAGFAIGRLTSAPPVYDPGGPTCTVDDFTVEDPGEWASVGIALLSAVRAEARRRGAVQIVVVCGHLDHAKRSLLAEGGLTIASEWWVTPL
jgi:GNAT superfamily N-acetyltransferase